MSDVVTFGPADDDDPNVQIEIAAARLIAGYQTADDTDDTIDDPICGEIIDQMIGIGDLKTDAAQYAFVIHESHRNLITEPMVTDALILSLMEMCKIEADRNGYAICESALNPECNAERKLEARTHVAAMLTERNQTSTCGNRRSPV